MIKKNNFIWIYLSIVLLIYILFFVSGNLFFSNIRTSATELNSTLNYQSRNITLLRWDYSEEQHLMEVELEVQNLAYDGINDYEFSCLFRPETKVNITQIISEDDYIILQIEDVPINFNESSLRLTLPDSNADSLKFYTNSIAVNRVSNLYQKSLTEYMTDRLYRDISMYEENIAALDERSEESKKTIENILLSIQSDEENKKYKTAAEIEEIETLISAKEEDIKSEENLIKSYEKEKTELLSKIDNAYKEITDLE